MFSDLHYVVRSLARARGFTAVTVLTLALGIGAAAAIFSVVDWVLFRVRAYPEDLVMLGAKTKEQAFMPAAFAPQVAAYCTLDGVFTETGYARNEFVNVVVKGEPVANGVVRVSPNFLALAGAAPVRGRSFLADEAAEGRNAVVVITHEFGREVFPDDADMIGRSITVDQTICTVVGVLAPRQMLPLYVYGQVFRPTELPPATPESWQTWYFTFARLRPGTSTVAAGQAMNALQIETPARMRDYWDEHERRVATMAEVSDIIRRENYWVLVGGVGFLYAIACLNATNLMVVRLLGRRRELSIRLALGGSRARLIRLLLLEGICLASLAGAAGVLVANWLVPLLMAVAQARQAFDCSRWGFDWRVITLLIGLTVVTALLIVLIPAVQILRTDVPAGLKQGGAALGETRGLARVRAGSVVLQAAFALILLTGAGLMVRSLERLHAVPLGFEINRRMKVRLDFPRGHLAGKEERHAFLKRLQEHLTHLPGVLSASYGTDTLLAGFYIAPVTLNLPGGGTLSVKADNVSANFLTTTGMRLMRGRMIAENEGGVMINEALARRYFGEEDPIGRTISKTKDGGSGAADWLVVGVVNDIRHNTREAPGFHVYTPESWWPPSIDSFILHVAREPDQQLASAVKRSIYELDPKVVVQSVAGLDEIRGMHEGMESYVTSVLKVLSVFALLLATVGMFSVITYTVDRRMGEFGVRLALGATARDLANLVVRRALLLATTGVLFGLAGAAALVRYLQSLLYETAPHDPAVLATVTGLLLAAAALACVWPARRATKADVASLLRRE